MNDLRTDFKPPFGVRPFYNLVPGADGLNSTQKSVNFVENHDGLNRFRVSEISERRNLLANALLLLSPGIPCLYYGTETGLQDTRGHIGPDAETGRLTFVRTGDDKRLAEATRRDDFKGIAALCRLRRELPALAMGPVSVLHPNNDRVVAFARGGDDSGLEPVIVVVNASAEEMATGAPGTTMKLVTAEGKSLLPPHGQIERASIPELDSEGLPFGPSPEIEWSDNGSIPRVRLQVGPESVNVYRLRR